MESLYYFWQQISAKDILDILLVAVLLYQILLIIKGTRAVQISMGVILLALLFWVGRRFELYSLNWILTHFFDYFFIILIIIFQEEIKSTLANFWANGKLLGVKKLNYYHEIEEVVEVCFRFSQQKVGALIVFERSNGLGNYTRTGTLLNGAVHADLLYSLFTPKSPLHDGAVIIAGHVIVSAGCFLPLSTNERVDRQFGSRHRAAIGLTEVSDAVVVIVSEESGRIGMCLGGRYVVCQSIKQLRDRLKHLLMHSQSGRNLALEFE